MDGGLAALGGFLYQTVGSLGLRAGYVQEYEYTLLNKNDLEKLLGFAKDGEVRYEDGDQDASIKQIFHDAQPGYILVQFKYSSLPPHLRPKIGEGELKNESNLASVRSPISFSFISVHATRIFSQSNAIRRIHRQQ